MSLEAGRRTEPGTWEHIIDQVLPVGEVLLYARPGAGKTRMAMQWEHAVAYGLPWAGWSPEAPGRVLVVDVENGAHMAINASIDLAAFGSLEVDLEPGALDLAPGPATRITVCTRWPGEEFGARFAELERQLREADKAGQPYKLVRIDTLRAFISPYPEQANSYRWEAACLLAINNLALELGLTIVVVHHTNKLGQVSGSTGIEGSVTASYLIDRSPGAELGKLVCTKNRAGPERHWEGVFEGGQWVMKDEITRGQAESTGVQRRILDYLAEVGPAVREEIRAALPGVKPDTVNRSISRLQDKGLIGRSTDGVWAALTRTGEPPPAPRCPGCGDLLDPANMRAGHRTHPWCEPDPRPEPGSDPGPGSATGEDQPGEPLEPCDACGMPVTGADTHPDCQEELASSVRWPGIRVMEAAIARSRMKPISCILRPEHPDVRPGMQTRDLPQWQLAARADIGAFRWARPGLLEDFDPGRLVLTIDRNASYPSSASSVPVAPNVLRPAQLEGNPKEAGVAGVAEIIVPVWDHPELPHPLGRNAIPGARLVVATGALEDLWVLHQRGLIAWPEILAAALGRRNTSLFEPFYKDVKAARAKHAGDPAMTIAVKRYSSIAIRMLYPKQARSPFWRPDWYAAWVSQAMTRHWIRAQQAVEAGTILAGLDSVDAAAFLVPEGADPATWIPEPYILGSGFGQVKVKPITVRTDRADLAGIDPERIRPARRGGPYAEISGPVPLSLWLARHA
jgi:hypothetical protein